MDQANFSSALFASIGATIIGFYSALGWWLLLGAVLILIDLRFGILAAQTRNEEIRFSRAWRRTICKAVDYLSWVTCAELLSRTFSVSLGTHAVSMGTLIAIFVIELSSCLNNYFTYKEIPFKFDPLRWLKKKTDLGEFLTKKKPKEKQP